MVSSCYICESPIKEGQYVQCAVRATYHRLKSKTIYALDKGDIQAVPCSLVHVECLDDDFEIHDPDDGEEDTN